MVIIYYLFLPFFLANLDFRLSGPFFEPLFFPPPFVEPDFARADFLNAADLPLSFDFAISFSSF